MIDQLAELRRMQSKDNNETFDPDTDSLERLSDALITYPGTTTADGAVSGLTLVDDALAAFASLAGQQVKILAGGSLGQTQEIVAHVGNTILVADHFTDSTGAIQQIVSGIDYVIISRLPGTSGGSDISFLAGLPSINESWEPANIDLNVWTPTDPATTPLAVVENTAPNVGYSVVTFDILDAEIARLIGRANVNRWRVTPNLSGVNNVMKALVFEWEVYFNDVAHIAAATVLMGFVTNPASTRATNDIVGFGITAGALVSITDRGGVEETNTTFGETLEDTRNKLRIEVGAGAIDFYVNEALVASHTTAANLPDQLMYPCWYMPSGATGADTFQFYLGAVRIGYIS